MLSWAADMPEYCASLSEANSPPVCNSQVPATSTFGLGATEGGSLASSATLNIAGQASLIYPGMQAQDGTFVGYVGLGPSPGTVTQYNMVAFNSSGSVQWSVPNDYPQIATADGGVIGGSGVKYDNQGRATGQIGNMPTQSYTAAYAISSDPMLLAVAFEPTAVASTYGAFAGGGPAAIGTADRSVAEDVRTLIAQIAESKVGSQHWLDQNGLNQCNIFVHDVLAAGGTTPPESDKTSLQHRIAYYLGKVGLTQIDSKNYPAQAGDWANASKTLGCWQTLIVPSGSPSGTLPPRCFSPRRRNR